MSSSERRRPRLTEGWPLTIAIGLLLLAAWAATLAVLGPNEAGWRTVVRNSARCTLTLFLLVFPASALVRRWPTPATRFPLFVAFLLAYVGRSVQDPRHLPVVVLLAAELVLRLRTPRATQ